MDHAVGGQTYCLERVRESEREWGPKPADWQQQQQYIELARRTIDCLRQPATNRFLLSKWTFTFWLTLQKAWILFKFRDGNSYLLLARVPLVINSTSLSVSTHLCQDTDSDAVVWVALLTFSHCLHADPKALTTHLKLVAHRKLKRFLAGQW